MELKVSVDGTCVCVLDCKFSTAFLFRAQSIRKCLFLVVKSNGVFLNKCSEN